MQDSRGRKKDTTIGSDVTLRNLAKSDGGPGSLRRTRLGIDALPREPEFAALVSIRDHPRMLCNIRRIHSGEAAHLRDIRLRALADSPRAFGGTFDADSERPSAYWEELATAWSDGDSGAAFVLEADGAWVGIAAGVRRFDQLGFVAEPGAVMLGWMWVAPKARRGGLGVQLTGEVVAWAADTGAREVHLWVTRGNEEALSLYRRAGFSPVDEHKPLASDASHDIERMVLTLGRPK